jgi:hypothetical protein
VRVRAAATADNTGRDERESLRVRLEPEGVTMYQISVYSISLLLWRWEVRCGGALLRCGTAPTRLAAQRDARGAVNA